MHIIYALTFAQWFNYVPLFFTVEQNSGTKSKFKYAEILTFPVIPPIFQETPKV